MLVNNFRIWWVDEKQFVVMVMEEVYFSPFEDVLSLINRFINTTSSQRAFICLHLFFIFVKTTTTLHNLVLKRKREFGEIVLEVTEDWASQHDCEIVSCSSPLQMEFIWYIYFRFWYSFTKLAKLNIRYFSPWS